MPRLQDIERFKRDLAALSREEEILARWGESPEDIPPPAGAQDATSVAREAKSASVDQPDEGLPPDFAALLDDLPLEKTNEDETRGEEDFAEAGDVESGDAALEALEALPEFDILESPAEATSEPEPEPEPSTSETMSGFELPEIAEDAEASTSMPADMPEFGLPEITEQPDVTETAEEIAPAAMDEFSIPDFGLEEPAVPSSDEIESLSAEGPVEKSAEEPAEDISAAIEEGPSVGETPPESTLPPGDDFESFSFEESPSGGGGFGFPERGIGADIPEGGDLGAVPASDFDSELASLGEAPEADTFNIDREWGGFGEQAEAGAPPKAAPPRPSAGPASEEKYRAVSLSEAQVDRLQDALLSYPLNLRVAIEDVLANERGSIAQRSKLVWAMVEGASPQDAALIASRVLKKRIEIPKGFEKKTGLALEAERGSFGYVFIHTVLPVLRIALLAAAAAAAIGWLGYRFVYTALAANAAYRSGYQRIAESRYPEAEVSFDKALSLREYVFWYYRYAEAYAAKRQYLLAEKKYASLVERHPKETKGILAWARLERDQLKYEEAVKILKGTSRRPGDESTRGMSGLLSWDYSNKEGLLLLGDIYLDWAEEDPKWYEEARRSYAGLIESYGQKDEYIERMLLFFIRTDNLKEVKPLEARYLAGVAAAKSKDIPIGARTLAELGGYLLDKGRIENVRTALTASTLKDPALPEAHYHLARYYRRSGALDEERKALDNAIRTFANLPGLSGKREGMYIDALIWRGNYRLEGGGWLAAEQDFGAAAAEYERAQELRRLKKSSRFAEAYAGLAEVAYWQRGELGTALGLYERAAADGYDTPDTRYKRGFILYNGGRTAESLPLFYRAGVDGAGSPYLEYAFGAALYARGDYFAAEGSFHRVVEAMTRELEQIGSPSPQARPSHGEIVELLMKAQNNLGASIYRTAARVGDARRRSAAMVAFAESTRLFDALTRDQITLVRTEAKNLGFLNMDFILHPQRGMDIAIYAEIEREMRFPRRQR